MDLMEIPESNQIQFKQVQGDFHRLQGKWILQQEVRPLRSVGHCLKQGVRLDSRHAWAPRPCAVQSGRL